MNNPKEDRPLGAANINDLRAVDQEFAPDIFVDSIPSIGIFNGIVRMNFETIVARQIGDDMESVRKLVATIKMTPAAANGLLNLLQQVAMATQPAANAGQPLS